MGVCTKDSPFLSSLSYLSDVSVRKGKMKAQRGWEGEAGMVMTDHRWSRVGSWVSLGSPCLCLLVTSNHMMIPVYTVTSPGMGFSSHST